MLCIFGNEFLFLILGLRNGRNIYKLKYAELLFSLFYLLESHFICLNFLKSNLMYVHYSRGVSLKAFEFLLTQHEQYIIMYFNTAKNIFIVCFNSSNTYHFHLC